jgi:CheY-like chemotaxis protein
MRKRLTICGFSEFEYKAMQFSFEHPAAGAQGYQVVDSLAEAHFIVVDGESPSAVKGVVLSGRVNDAVFVGAGALSGAAAHLPRPIDPTRILRALDEMTPRELAPREPPASATAPADDMPPLVLRELPVVDEEVTAPPTRRAAATPQSRLAAKAAARAAVRRAQLADRHHDGHVDEPVPDALVLDRDPQTSQGLCELLTRFGFGVEAVADIVQARAALSARHFAVMFLDIALDGADQGEGLALLEDIHALPLVPGRAEPAIVLVASRLEPADRVRASLAGVGIPLLKPVSRGDVARSLETRGIALPADARRR